MTRTARGAVVVAMAICCCVTSPADAGDGSAIPTGADLRLRETATTIDFEETTRGRFRLSLDVPYSGTSRPQSVGVTIDALTLDVPLGAGRHRGRLGNGSGHVRVRVRCRGGVLRMRVRGTARGVESTLLGRSALYSAANALYWNGPMAALGTGSLRLDGREYSLAIGLTGRADIREPPARAFGPPRRDTVFRVALVGAGLLPGEQVAPPIVQLAPRLPRQRWKGRVHGHVLQQALVPTLSFTVDGAGKTVVDPIDAELLGFGSGTPVAPGVSALQVGGVTVHQLRFDEAVPAATGPRRLRVRAEDDAGRHAAARLDFVAPATAPPLLMDESAHVLEVREGGALWAWGENLYGEVGDGTSRTPRWPVPLARPGPIRAVAAGEGISLAVDDRGLVWQWGEWTRTRQIAPGVFESRDIGTRSPTLVDWLRDIVGVAAGDDHALALDDAGRVWTWGDNLQGQLGDGTQEPRPRRPRKVRGLPQIREVAAGWESSLALDVNGDVWAWGDHLLDGLGDDNAPMRVPGLPPIRDIDARGIPLAVAEDGTVWTWGLNDGLLGDGTTVDRPLPVRIVGLTDVVAVDAGDFHCLALTRDGTAWAWGDNEDGELGDGTSESRLTPVPVRGLADFVDISAGTFHSLGLTRDGTLWEWGLTNGPGGAVGGLTGGGTGEYPVLARRRSGPGHYRDAGGSFDLFAKRRRSASRGRGR